MHCIFGSGRPNYQELIFGVFIYTEGDLCLMFYLHMYGEGTGEIRVYQRFTDGSPDAELQTRGTDGEESNVHYITLTASAIRYV